MVAPTNQSRPDRVEPAAVPRETDNLRFRTDSVRWFCVHTKPRQEPAVAAYLEEQLGLETYFPQLREHRTIRRVRRLVTSALFPRYLFCRFDLGLHFRAVRHAPEVLDVVRFGTLPAAVDDAIVTELRAWAGDEGNIITLPAEFKTGDVVTIKSGPMSGLQAVIRQASNDRDRVAVLLSHLEYQAQVMISRSLLERTG